MASREDANTSTNLSNWRYHERKRWHEIPTWCQSLAKLGASTEEYAQPGEKLTLLLTLPTVAYAGVFVTLGSLLSAARREESVDLNSHFQTLKKMPPESIVTYFDGGRVKDAILEGIEERYGHELIAIRIGTQKRHLIPVSKCESIQLSGKESIRLYKNQKGREPASNSPFLRSALTGIDADIYCRVSRLCAVIIGNEMRLGEELGTRIRVRDGDQFEDGLLREILRLDGTSKAYRCAIQSDRKLKTHYDDPEVVVFESSIAYLRFASRYRHAHRIVLLDRCEPSFADAIDQFNLAYSSECDRPLNTLSCLPPAAEASGYLAVPR